MKIETETPSLMIIKDSRIWPYAVAVLFITSILLLIFNVLSFNEIFPLLLVSISFLCLLPLLVFPLYSFYAFDKTKNSMIIERRFFLGKKNEIKCALSDIKGIEWRQEDKGSDSFISYSINILLDKKDPMPIVSGGESEGFKYSIPNVASRIAGFLNVPLTEVRLPEYGDTLNAIKKRIIK